MGAAIHVCQQMEKKLGVTGRCEVCAQPLDHTGSGLVQAPKEVQA